MAASVVLYGTPRIAVGTVVVVISSPTTSNVNTFVVTNAGAEESLTCTVTFLDPGTVATPDTTPVLAPIDNPAGSAPEEIDHVLGATPPLTANCIEYASPTTGLSTVAVVIVGPATLIVRFFVADAAGVAESVISTVNALAYTAVGVPEMDPVAPLSDSPGGSTPREIDHEYGIVAPDAVRATEYGTSIVAPGRVLVVIVGFAAASAPPGHRKPTIIATMKHKIRTRLRGVNPRPGSACPRRRPDISTSRRSRSAQHRPRDRLSATYCIGARQRPRPTGGQ